MVDVGSGLKKKKKSPLPKDHPVPRPSRKISVDSLELKGLAWCVKQAFSSWNRKSNINWANPNASGEMILAAERFLRKYLSTKDYLKVFKMKDWGKQYE